MSESLQEKFNATVGIENSVVKTSHIKRSWLWLNVGLVIFVLLLVGLSAGFYYAKFQQINKTIDQLQVQSLKVLQASGVEEEVLAQLQKTVSDQSLQLQEQHRVLERLSLFSQQRQTEVFLQIAHANQQVDALSLLGSPIKEEKSVPKISAPSMATWKQHLMQTLDQLKFLIVVRKTPDPLLPLMAQENGGYINQYIHLQLGQAQWAVLRNNNPVYQACLSQAHLWVSRYFVAQDPKTEELLHDIEVLQKIDVSFPAITNGETS